MILQIKAWLRKRDLKRWARQGSWTLADRALFALSNFGLNVALARWLELESYGAFALAYSIFLLAGTAQSSIISGPMLILGSGRFKDRLPAYLGLLIKGHALFSAITITILAAAGGVAIWLDMPAIGNALLALAVAGPFIKFLRMQRRFCYVVLKPMQAAGAGAIYMVLLFAGTFAVHKLGLLSPEMGFLVMGASALVVGVILAVQQKPQLFAESLFGTFGREVLSRHWYFAKWGLSSHIMTEARLNLFVLVLPIWGGLEAVAILRAMANLTMPVAFMTGSLGLIIAPALVRSRGTPRFRENSILILAFFLMCTISYAIAINAFRLPITDFLYKGKYLDYALLVLLLSCTPIVRSFDQVLASALRAQERPDLTFWASAGGSVVAMTVGVVMIYLAGPLGAAIGALTSAIVSGSLMLWFVAVKLKWQSAPET